ncbi:hypothetical protein [Curtobacterium sp. MCSS17_006]|uniref:hypothetical protein n=1 Tax=Curtobacterium sp. MCSS17_006 TaxID=2175642 RepID=UPI0011B76C96|nr:hypothetical protein [Curtobacterium sp. MCSS17_006]MBT1675391.1 hypothetical protein [Curtobacterium flaccumfaciens pv. flaccumfaciens]
MIGAIVTGAMLSTVGATAAAAAPASTISVSANAGERGVSGVVPMRSSPVPSSPVPQGENSTNRVPIGSIVNWIKKNASSIMTGMKNAVRGGINNFKRWWNGLAGWIRAGITAVGNMSVTELFSALWNYFFG